jgi:hypothetical protein
MVNKRIEVNEKVAGLRARASRTGGATAAVSPLKGFTLNSKHGARVSKTFSGLTLGFQNLNSVVRGRWTGGGINLNLSKSGFSFSSKGLFGTYNLLRPKRSSATVGGIQVRGQVGMIISLIGVVIQAALSLIGLAWSLLKFSFIICVRLVPFLLWFGQLFWNLIMLGSSVLLYLLLDFPRQLLSKLGSKN